MIVVIVDFPITTDVETGEKCIVVCVFIVEKGMTSVHGGRQPIVGLGFKNILVSI